MNDEQQMKKSILSVLHHCGVPVSKLNLSVAQGHVVLTGSVDTFYALQLIQCQLRLLLGEHNFTNQVKVTQAQPLTRQETRRLSAIA